MRITKGPNYPLDIEARLLKGAEDLASNGMWVFPLYGIRSDLKCSCGASNCKVAGKHPHIKNWKREATNSLDRIQEWWADWPDANIGVATGAGLVVIDIDSSDALKLAQDMGYQRETPSVRTGRGYHLYCRGEARNRVDMWPGIDIRGNGGYVVAPPSVHASGEPYQWIEDLACPLAELPEWALRSRESKPTPSTSDILTEGERNDRLFRLGCSMRNVGMTDKEIAAALATANEERCDLPLSDLEMTSLIRSVCRYPVGREIDNILLALKLGPHATSAYLAIRAHCNYDGECFRSYDGIAEETGIGRTTVVKAVQTLVDAGLIRKFRQNFRQSNVYVLCN